MSDIIGFQLSQGPEPERPVGTVIGEPIRIRYDGLDAEQHEIELGALAESLRGMSRIIGVSANFAATGRYVQHKDTWSVKVVAKPPEAHCFELYAWVRWAAQEPLIVTILGGSAVLLIGYVFKRAAGQREEMRAIKDSLDKAIKELGTRDQSQVDRLLATIDKMADALRPSVRSAVRPVGETAGRLTISDGSGHSVSIGQAERDAIVADSAVDISHEQTIDVKITELDTISGNCKVSFSDSPDDRLPAIITDPAALQPNNAYVMALASHRSLLVRAKFAISDGSIAKIYISDTA